MLSRARTLLHLLFTRGFIPHVVLLARARTLLHQFFTRSRALVHLLFTMARALLHLLLTLSTCMPYGTSWPDNADAVAVQLDKMIINA